MVVHRFVRTAVLASLCIVLSSCAEHAAPARHIVTPAHDAPWRISVTALGGSLERLDAAIADSFAANTQIVRAQRDAADGHVDLTVTTAGEAVVAETCTADVHVVVYRGSSTTPIDDRTQQLSESCGIHGHAVDRLYAQSVAWAIEHALQLLAQPE